MTREVMEQALDALESGLAFDAHSTVLQNLRKALAHPVQEPSQWRDMVVVSLVREGVNKHKARELADHFAAQPEPEPVACRFCHSKKGCWTWQCYSCGEIDDVQKPTPPAVQRKPLTHIQAKELVAKYGNDLLKLVFQTEAAHGIKEQS